IYDLAAEVARAHIPDADLPVAIRHTGVDPLVHEVAADELQETTSAAVNHACDTVAGTVGVVVPVGRRDVVEGWLGERDTERVPVLEALDTKGLEFDGIVVVQPDEIVQEADVGMRMLYVVLTRATQRLEVVGTSHAWRP
nr:ATP-binding domain-containing protein [Propionibacteriales bacterium]